jgi:hypothetical protein
VEGDQLYGLPLEQFVPERSVLAKALRAEGRREDASDVAKLRKPSVAAWAVNQLVRTQGQAVAELFAAGDALMDAHTAVVSGTGDGQSLREAATRERTAVDTLVGAARGLLSTDGHDLSPAIIDRVADTLHAAALDEEARAQVRDGRLERELRHVGLGAASFAGALPTARAAREPRPEPKPAPGPARKPAPPAKPEEPKPDRTAERRAARIAEAEARRRSERAEHALRRTTEARDRAAAELQAAEDALAQAEAEAREAAEAHRQAAEQLNRLRR